MSISGNPILAQSKFTLPYNSRFADELTKNSKILIIDDEPVNFRVAQKYLAQAGYENFTTTTDSARAFEIIKTEHPDVVLLDVCMPEMSGLEILKKVRSNETTSPIPVIILTASDDQETKQQALLLGATDFLSKPVHAIDLVPRVRNALTVKAYQDQLKRHTESLKDEVDLRTRELKATRLEVIHCLARAAEYRDNETGRHVIRVGKYVGIVARKLNLDDEFVELMEHASPMHDIGKIGLPDNILLKSQKLSPDEFKVMQEHTHMGKRVFECISGSDFAALQSHTDIGSKIMQSTCSPLLAMAERIALTHHEKWDGTGYPLGLAGENIPIEGRITAVADVYDALSSKRPYKPAFPLQKCLKILEEERGHHFDPKVLDAFFAVTKEIIGVQLELPDLE